AMRTESFVYVLGSVAISCGVLGFSRRRWGGAFLLGALAIVGFAAVFLTNLLLEGAVLGEQIRGSRASGAASGGLDELLSRAEEGLLTFATPTPRGSADSWMVGLVLAGALALLARWSTRRGQRRLAVGAAVLVGIVYLLRAVDGLGFVPGMVAATPFVGVALGLGWDDVRSRLLLAYAFVPLPLVFAFQFRGGALPQWAGRYILLSGLVAGVVGIAASSRMAPWARRYVTLLAVGVTCFGLAWLSLRSHDVAAAGARFVERPEEVLVSPDGFVPREFGAFYGERRWLSANPDTLPTALDVLDRSGIEEWGLVEVAPPEQPRVFDGWVVAGVEEVPFLDGAPLTVTTYRRA
ncbi:MAG: hypothetical protein MUF83_08545, partial [Acidimicrobiales bacterium]|nr:hypothetical protein [Acidimicrobiales bacterium]